MKKGWFWIVPIYWREEDQTLFPRFKWLQWALDLMMAIHHSMMFFAALCGVDIEEGYPIRITEDSNQDFQKGDHNA